MLGETRSYYGDHVGVAGTINKGQGAHDHGRLRSLLKLCNEHCTILVDNGWAVGLESRLVALVAGAWKQSRRRHRELDHAVVELLRIGTTAVLGLDRGRSDDLDG